MDESKRKESLGDMAYSKLKELIISLNLQPGLQLHPEDLENELSIGRTPVREALLRLSSEGLLNSIQGRGFFVRHVALEDVKALLEATMILERPCVSLAARRISRQEIDRLIEINSELEAAMVKDEYLLVTMLNSQFHEIIHESIKNEFLTAALQKLESQYQRLAYFCFSKMTQSNDLKQHFAKVIADHAELIECFINRDETEAVNVITRHIHLFNSRISKYLKPPVPEYSVIPEPSELISQLQ